MEANITLEFRAQSKKPSLVCLRLCTREKRYICDAAPDLREGRFQCHPYLRHLRAASAADAGNETARHEVYHIFSPHTFIRRDEGRQAFLLRRKPPPEYSCQTHIVKPLLVKARTREILINYIANRLIVKHGAVESLDLLLRRGAQRKTRSGDIDGKLLLHVRCRRDDGICAERRRKLARQFIRAANVTRKQTDDMLRLLVEHENGRIFQLALQRTRNHAHGNSRRHDENKRVILAKCRRYLRREALINAYSRRHFLPCLAEDIDARIKRCANAKSRLRAARRRRENSASHLLASRNMWLNSGA